MNIDGENLLARLKGSLAPMKAHEANFTGEGNHAAACQINGGIAMLETVIEHIESGDYTDKDGQE